MVFGDAVGGDKELFIGGGDDDDDDDDDACALALAPTPVLWNHKRI